jgi:hypothetical protein
LKRVPLSSVRLKASSLVHGREYAASVRRAARAEDALFIWVDDATFDELRDMWEQSIRKEKPTHNGADTSWDDILAALDASGDQALVEAAAKAREFVSASTCSPCQRSARLRGLRQIHADWLATQHKQITQCARPCTLP